MKRLDHQETSELSTVPTGQGLDPHDQAYAPVDNSREGSGVEGQVGTGVRDSPLNPAQRGRLG